MFYLNRRIKKRKLSAPFGTRSTQPQKKGAVVPNAICAKNVTRNPEIYCKFHAIVSEVQFFACYCPTKFLSFIPCAPYASKMAILISLIYFP